MNPSVKTVLEGLARSVMMDLGPEVKSGYGTQTVQLGAMLMMMIAQEFDRAAARFAEENEALRALFAEAARLVSDPQLEQALAHAASTREASLLVSALHEENRALRALLIRLHEHVEELEDPPARALEKHIWEELIASTRRRHLDLAVE